MRPYIYISRKFFVLVSLFVGLLFCGRDILMLFCKQFPHLYPIVNVSRLTFEEVYCYLPIFNDLSFFEFPSLMSMHPSQIGRLITVIIEGVIYKWLCFSNIDVFMFLSHLVFPLCSFWLIFLVYKRYVSRWWALLLAFWGIMFYDNFSMFGYLFHVFLNPSDIISASSLSPLEITRTPFPSFSFFIFILCFYLSTLTYKISERRYVLLTVLWSLNAYIYLVNFVAGVIFWFSFVVFAQYMSSRRSFAVKSVSKTLLLNILVMCAIISPLLVRLFLRTDLDKEIIVNLGLSYRNAGMVFSKWGVFFSYILPIAMVVIVIRVYCGDYYELMYRFMPILIMVIVELIILNLHMILGVFFQTYLFSIRIGNFFLLYLYFIPIIYFFSAPFKPLFHNTIKNRIAGAIHNFFANYIIRYQVVISLLGVVLTSVLVVSSTMKYYDSYKKSSAVQMKSVYSKFEELTSTGAEGILVSEDMPVNMLLPILSKNSSLFMNSFNSYVRTEGIVDRLVLYAHIFNWDVNRFLDFMLPNKAYDDFYTKNDFVVSEDILENGFGHWLVWHLYKMDESELAQYKQDILNKFKNMNIKEAAKKYNLTVIQAFGNVNPLLPVELLRSEKGSRLYRINITGKVADI